LNTRQLLIIIALLLVKQGYSQEATNYNLNENWAVLPTKLPQNILNTIHDSTLFQSIDVFYVYPTLLIDSKDQRWNISVQDSSHRKEVLDYAVKFQASAWAESGRMYVPYYQQAHIRSYDSLENGGRDALLFAYADIKAAFEYYLKNYNHGRGIILAGHSQGSTHINLLLKDFFDGKSLQKQLVAAYLPGIGIPSNEFNTIPFLTNAKEIGGFVTWNTFKKKLNQEKYEKWYYGKAVVNPITWDLSPLSKKSQQNGFYYNNEKKYKHVFQTELISGGLVLTKLRFPFNLAAWKMNDFHIGDVNLFWENIHQNSKLRGQEWVLKNTP
jgi:hypothetical protein